MDSQNFDFGGFIDDDNKAAFDFHDRELPAHITVLSGLQDFCGKSRGRQIYGFLARMASRASEENGGQPGILFDEQGGCFVSFHNQLPEFDSDT